VIRNGWFSYRWSQIFDRGNIPAKTTVLTARPVDVWPQAAFAPPPIDEVIAAIHSEKPDLVFAAHVETSAGIMLPDDYLKAVSKAVHEVGGLFVLDCIASGTVWVDMKTCGVDVLISAPQKGWSAPPCGAFVMLSRRAEARLGETTSSSFACDLAKWRDIMRAYEAGGHAYHATMPTDALRSFRDIMLETKNFGFSKVKDRQLELGSKIRSLLQDRGFRSVAAEGFTAPGVVVCYTEDDGIHKGSAFAQAGMQIAAGVPLAVGEPEGFKTFRLGLFGLDKLYDVDAAVKRFAEVLDKLAHYSD
jgi:aspartate aminotransferase-like enzyme